MEQGVKLQRQTHMRQIWTSQSNRVELRLRAHFLSFLLGWVVGGVTEEVGWSETHFSAV